MPVYDLFFLTRAPERLALVAEAVLIVSDEGFDLFFDGKQPGHLSGVKGDGETTEPIHGNRAFLGDFQRKRLGRVFLFLFQFRVEGRDLLLKGCEVVLIFFRVRFEVCCHDFFLSLEGVYTDYSKVGGECQGLFFIGGGRVPRSKACPCLYLLLSALRLDVLWRISPAAQVLKRASTP